MLDRIRRVDHRSAHGTWQMEYLAPPPTLAPFVRRIKAYAERDTDFVRRRELPTGRAVLLFNFGGELRIEDAAGNRARFFSGAGSTRARAGNMSSVRQTARRKACI